MQIDKPIVNILIADTYPNINVLSFLTIHVRTSPIKEKNIITQIASVVFIISPPNCFKLLFYLVYLYSSISVIFVAIFTISQFGFL